MRRATSRALYDSYMRTLPISEARENLAEVIDEVRRMGDRYA